MSYRHDRDTKQTCKQCSAVYLQGLLSQQGDLLKVDKENLGLYLQPNFV